MQYLKRREEGLAKQLAFMLMRWNATVNENRHLHKRIDLLTCDLNGKTEQLRLRENHIKATTHQLQVVCKHCIPKPLFLSYTRRLENALAAHGSLVKEMQLIYDENTEMMVKLNKISPSVNTNKEQKSELVEERVNLLRAERKIRLVAYKEKRGEARGTRFIHIYIFNVYINTQKSGEK